MIRLITAVALTLAAFFWSGCSKDNAVAPPTDKVHVTFRGTSMSAVKAATAPTNGIHVNIMTYERGADLTTAGLVVGGSKSYVSDNLGNLTGEAILLDTRAYDFYSVSENTPSAPRISFTTGVAAVSNSVDYLWGMRSKEISTADHVVNLTYTHSAVKITVEMLAAPEVRLTPSGTTIQLTPSDDKGAQMTLANGKITPAGGVHSSTAMTMIGTTHTGSYVMVPLSAGQKIDFVIKVNASSAYTLEPPVDMIYNAQVTAPAGGYVGGKEYKYTATVSFDQIMFSGATVTEWEVINNDLPLVNP